MDYKYDPISKILIKIKDAEIKFVNKGQKFRNNHNAEIKITEVKPDRVQYEIRTKSGSPDARMTNSPETMIKILNRNGYVPVKDSATKDMPLSFKSNLNLSALKSNVRNLISKPTDSIFVSSLEKNLDAIQADRLEWNSYSKKNIFYDYPNIKSICGKLCNEYIKVLNDLSDNKDIDKNLRNKINRCILNLDADKYNIFR